MQSAGELFINEGQPVMMTLLVTVRPMETPSAGMSLTEAPVTILQGDQWPDPGQQGELPPTPGDNGIYFCGGNSLLSSGVPLLLQ